MRDTLAPCDNDKAGGIPIQPPYPIGCSTRDSKRPGLSIVITLNYSVQPGVTGGIYHADMTSHQDNLHLSSCQVVGSL